MRFRASRFVPLLILAGTLAYTGGADATVWQIGDEITYDQSAWGDPTTSAGQLLNANYNTVYASTLGILEVGIPGAGGFSIRFGTAADVDDYLLALGAPSALTADYLDPSTTTSGQFGGDVTALKLNIDFSDDGITLGNTGIPFGDLILVNLSDTPDLNGLTVRQFLGIANTALGGGTTTDSILNLDQLTLAINQSFSGGGLVSDFAQSNLVAPNTVSVPEPITLSLFGAGLAGAIAMRRRKTKKA